MTDTEHIIDTVKAIHDYISTEPSCLSFMKGDRLLVYTKDASGWWDGSIGDGRGWFPSNFVEKYVEPQQQRPQHHSINSNSHRMSQDVTSRIFQNGTPRMSQSGTPRISQSGTPRISHSGSPRISQTDLAIAAGGKTLPRFWGMKVTKEGQVYYYNSKTDQSTFHLATVMNESVNHGTGSTDGNILSETLNATFYSSSNSLVPVAQSSLLDKNLPITWELLINNILRSISDLNQCAKQEGKGSFISNTNQIVISIRDMLASSGCISRENAVLKENKALQNYHLQIIGSLSKLVLTSKIASGVWPPPDAVNKMRYQAGQVLLSIRHFVSIAQDIPLDLTPITDFQTLEEFDIKGAQLSDIEFISRLNIQAEQIINTISLLFRTVNDSKKQQQNSIASNGQKITVIDQARQVVTEIGQFLSLVEEPKILNVKSIAKLLGRFYDKKEKLYIYVNDLVTIARLTVEPYGNSNALDKLLETTFACEKCVEELSAAVKLIVDQDQSLEPHLLAQEAEINDNELNTRRSMMASNDSSDLGLLQRRAMSLTFSKSNVLEGIQSGNLSIEDLYGDHTKNTLPTRADSNSKTDVGASKSASMPPLAKSNTFSASSKSQDSLLKLSKIEKLFGEEPIAVFLKYDYLSDQISFNMEGQVNGGTIPALVERLTLHDQPVAFLMMYKQFTTTEVLLELLLSRFFLEPPVDLNAFEFKLWTDKKQTPIRLRVYNALKSLVENYWSSSDNSSLPHLLQISSTQIAAAMPNIAVRLTDVLTKRIASLSSGISTTSEIRYKRTAALPSDTCPSPIVPRNISSLVKKDSASFIMDIDPLEIARQLTVLESKIFCDIHISELMNQEWTNGSKSTIAINVRKSSKTSTSITGWIVQTILGEPDLKKRANLLKQIIKIGDRCLLLNNFSTLMSIVSALNSSTIDRLKKTWEILSSKTRQTFESLKKATDLSRNYASYRQALKQCSPPCLPFLGLFLTDLTFTEDGNPNTRGNKLVNFDKYYKMSRIIVEFQRLQRSYNLTPVPEIQEFLRAILDTHEKPQDLYRVSLMLEPREGSPGRTMD